MHVTRARRKFQSTLPQGERLDPGQQATASMTDFNPRSRKGSDTSADITDYRPDDFNPRSRKGSDLFGIDTLFFVITISIHAPARGATYRMHTGFPMLDNFNPRSRKGSDNALITRLSLLRYFNPRSRKGSDDQPGQYRTILTLYFNPRSRKGSDHDNPNHGLDLQLFQSTLPQGERPYIHSQV